MQQGSEGGEIVGLGVDGVLSLGLATHHALVLISCQAGDFEEGGKVANLLLACTYLCYRRSAEYPAFFGV